ncbi:MULTISPECIES: hypothetical protein [unclassified Serratia]|uniref:hypothetical protein n=1 Tax=unclassified Serratia (in: enterobacteria) TaxID=2647522 RepID=UPI000469391C
MNKIFTLILASFSLIASNPALSAGQPYMRCGDYVFSTSGNDDGFVRINGAKPESQKITFLKQKEDYNNIKMEWRMATSQPGLWVGMEYIKRDGKAFLNTQMLRASMNSPREFATYDCVKVK